MHTRAVNTMVTRSRILRGKVDGRSGSRRFGDEKFCLDLTKRSRAKNTEYTYAN